MSLADLRERIRRIEQPVAYGVLPFGAASIDRALPGGGLALGAVHEILGAAGDEEDGAAVAGFVAGILARLSLSRPHPPLARASGPPSPALRERVKTGHGVVLWCLKQPDLYGPGLAEHGLDPARLILVTARRDDELLWAIEEALRPGTGLVAVVGEIGRLPMVAGRRLQLAAERSGITAFLLRRWRNAAEATAERNRPSAALTRWRIAALPSQSTAWAFSLYRHPGEGRGPFLGNFPADQGTPALAGVGRGKTGMGQPRWRIELLRCRGGLPGGWDVEVADAAGFVSVSAGLADRPAAPRRRSLQPVPQRLAG